MQDDPMSYMSWDADGNRIDFTSSTGGTTGFVYDTTAGIPAVVEEVLPSDASVYYVREPNGALIARIAGTGVGQTTQYYHFDALGSTRLLTDADSEVTDTYTYDAWGQTTSHGRLTTGSVDQPYQYVGQLGYYTHYQDENMNTLQLGVRFYDPALGRFSQVDPMKQGIAWYVYALDNPAKYADPRGLAASDDERKRAQACAQKCIPKCLGDAKCLLKCMGECLGDSYYDEWCPRYLCVIYPDMPQCQYIAPARGNPCAYKSHDPDMWQSCCELQKKCCEIRNSPTKCDAPFKTCMTKAPCAK